MDIKKYTAVLSRLHSELSSQLMDNAEATDIVALDQAAVGRLSRMDALQGQAMAQETKRRKSLELTKVRSALQRIENGEYGYCLRCDEEIAENRLKIDPAATPCIECANQLEKE